MLRMSPGFLWSVRSFDAYLESEEGKRKKRLMRMTMMCASWVMKRVLYTVPSSAASGWSRWKSCVLGGCASRIWIRARTTKLGCLHLLRISEAGSHPSQLESKLNKRIDPNPQRLCITHTLHPITIPYHDGQTHIIIKTGIQVRVQTRLQGQKDQHRRDDPGRSSRHR